MTVRIGHDEGARRAEAAAKAGRVRAADADSMPADSFRQDIGGCTE